VCVQKSLSCQQALRVTAPRYLRGGKRQGCSALRLLVLLEGSRPISAGGTRYSHLV